jgi:O-methyltransferase domain/Dimerisation domain
VTTDPGAVWRVIHGYTGYWVAVAGVKLGVFDALADGPLDATDLAARCGAAPRPAGVIADGLTAIGLLTRDDAGYALSDTAAAHLVTGRPAAMADLLVWSPGPEANWPLLDEIARGGRPPAPIEDDAAAFYERLVDATLPSQLVVARAALGALEPAPGCSLLELGAGRAPWASALLDRDPVATAVVNDLPEVLEGTPPALGASATRCSFVAGDYLGTDIPAGPFDLVVLGHVLRAEPDERARRLVGLAAGRLAPGGRLVVTEYLGGRDPATHPQPALLAATMLAATVDGRICTADEIETWLGAAGCRVVAGPGPVANTDILIAERLERGGRGA